MFKKVNIKIILLVFASLLAIVVISEIIDSKKGDRTFRKDLVNVSADNISSIVLFPKTAKGKEIKLYKEGDTWKVSSAGKTSLAESGVASNLISALNELKPESVVSTNKDKWEKFEVTDSTATRVQLFEGDKMVTDILIGKYNYSQSSRKMTTYVRLASDVKVYGVEGYGAMSFNRDYNALRDKTVIKSDKEKWTKLSFSYPADSSFTLEKVNDHWLVNNATADSASVAKFLGQIHELTDPFLTDEVPISEVTHSLTIEGNDMLQPIIIDGFDQGDKKYIISNQHEDAVFANKSLFEKLFPSKSNFEKK